MSRYYLSKLSIEGFRGINNRDNPLEMEFDPDKVTSIFGRNGTGKSSVFEALVYAISGEVPRLSKMQSTENPNAYYVNKFHAGQACIILTFAADDTGQTVNVVVRRDGNGQRVVESSDVSDPEAFLREIDSETLWIDFNKFNDFVLATPLDRGREFSKLLGLSKISSLRAGLSALSDTRAFNSDSNRKKLKEDLDRLQQDERQSKRDAISYLSGITQHGFSEDTFEPDAVAAACVQKMISSAVVGELFTGTNLEQVDFDQCRDQITAEEGGPLRAKYERLIQIKSDLDKGYHAEDIHSQLTNILANVKKRDELIDQSKGAAFKDLYSAALKIASSNSSNVDCPLCEREWAHPSGLGLFALAQDELRKFDEVVALEGDIKSAWRQVTHNQRLLDVERILINLTTDEAAASVIQATQVAVLPSEADLNNFSIVLAQIDTSLNAALKDLERSTEELQAQLPKSLVEILSSVHNAEELAKCLKSYKSTAAKVLNVQEQLVAVEKWHDFISEVTRLCSEAETDLIKETIQQLGQDIKQIYEEIMPYSDILPKISRDSDSEKLFLELEKFFGLSDLDAIPLLSESYRNALGLSVYLAECKRRSYGGRFIVIDDVTSSFDSGHQNFLVTAIYRFIAKPVNHHGLQVIMLSHDGLLEKFFDNCSSNGWAWTSMKLQGVSPTGLVHSGASYGPRVRANLEEKLDVGDVDSALPLLRQYFEFKLMEIIRELHIRVPVDFAIRDDKKMIRNMIDAIEHDLDLNHRLGDCCLPITSVTLVRDTLIPSLVANYVQHYESGSTASFTSGVVKGIMGKIDSLANAFQYTCNCSRTPKMVYYRSLTQKRKGCSTACS